MTSPHQDAADLVAELRAFAPDGDTMPRTRATMLSAANLIEQQAKALSEASQTCNSYSNRALAAEASLAEAKKVIELFADLVTRYDDTVSDGWMPWVEFLNEEAWPSEEECAAARSFLNSASNKEPR